MVKLTCMKYAFTRVGCGLLLSASLLAGALTASAQPGDGCPLISDDALTAALGSRAHALGVLSTPPSTDPGPTVADMCFGQFGIKDALVLAHVVGVTTPGDVTSTLALTQDATTGPEGIVGGNIDASALTVTPIGGLGDSAVLVSGSTAGNAYANLVIWRRNESFSLAATGLSDAQSNLTAIAQAILAGQP